MSNASPTLTVADLCLRLERPARTVKRLVAQWAAQGWPLVRREPCRGNARGRYVVDRASFEAYCVGDLGPLARAA